MESSIGDTTSTLPVTNIKPLYWFHILSKYELVYRKVDLKIGRIIYMKKLEETKKLWINHFGRIECEIILS